MWQLDNRTPFAADRSWVRDHNGREIWQVVVKASYHFDPSSGAVRIAKEQIPVNLACEYRGGPGASSLRYETDFALEKPCTDIIVNGSVWGSDGKQARRLVAGFSVGSITKAVQVTGKRIWLQGRIGLIPSDPKPFTQLPLIWENAYGGSQGVNPDTDFPIVYPANPVGCGYYETPEAALNSPLPFIETLNKGVIRWSDQAEPAGLSAIAGHWSPRRELSGTYDELWRQNRYPLPPNDQHPNYWQYAPKDQQSRNYLQGGEPVRLVNLHPINDIRFVLPRMALRFHTRFSARRIQTHYARITALILEPDDCRFSVVHQTDLPCQGWEDDLLNTRIEMEPST